MQESISRLKLDWNQGPFAEPSHPPPSVFLCCFHIQVLEVQKVERQYKRLPEEPIKTHFMSGYVNHRGNHWDGLRTALCAPWLCSEKKSMWWRGCSGSLVFLDQESGWRKKPVAGVFDRCWVLGFSAPPSLWSTSSQSRGSARSLSFTCLL